MEELRLGRVIMRKTVLTIVLALVMIAAFLVPAARNGSAAVGVKVGDYWKYSSGADVEGMSASINEKMKVTGTEGSGSSEVYVITLSGSGDVSGSVSGSTVTGSVDITGEIKRLTSNFSMVSSDMEMNMHISMVGQSATMKIGIQIEYSPALDDFIGDNGLGHGATLVSRSTATVTTSTDIEVNGQHQTDSSTDTESIVQTIQIGVSNETVSVKAGSFDCFVCTYTLDMGGMTESLTYYYSSEAGNYVKASGTSSSLAGGVGIGDLEAFSYGGGGSSSSMLSGTTLLIIVVVVVLVIVVVSLVLMMRRRGRTMVPMAAPPPESNYPPPPTAPPPAGPGPGS